jgi:hypothetical protein
MARLRSLVSGDLEAKRELKIGKATFSRKYDQLELREILHPTNGSLIQAETNKFSLGSCQIVYV